jgi:hypothetical protein
MGFVLGGLIADRVEEAANVIIAFATIGGILAAGIAVARNREVTRWSASGGALGLGVGVLVAVADALIGG